MQKAVFIDFKETDIENQYLNRLKKLFSVTDFISADDLKSKEVLKNTDVIFSKIFTKIDKGIIDAGGVNLKYIGVLATAFDAIDTKYARSKNITVCNLGGYSTEAVSEFFFAALLEQIRALEQSKQQARQEDYSFDKFMGLELKDKVLGVIGAGKIGKRIAEIGLAFGAKVSYFSRVNKPEIDKLGAQKKELDEILKTSDFIALTLALNEETKGIISKDKLDLLKKGCVLINIAPPPLIDQEAMLQKSATGDIIFIFDHSDDLEPTLAKRFLENKNCIVYPPIAFRTIQANTARWEIFTSNIENFTVNKPQNIVN